MNERPELSEAIYRLLPGEQWKRVRQAILEAATYSGQRTDQLRQSIDEANRLQTGRLVDGTVDFTSPTDADLSGFGWVINYEIHQLENTLSIPVDSPDDTYSRPDIFVGKADGSIEYRPGTMDEEGNVQEPSYDPVTEVLLRAVVRNPDLSNDEDGGSVGTSSFVSKVATGTEVMQGNLAMSKQSNPAAIPVRMATYSRNGMIYAGREVLAGVYSTRQFVGGYSPIVKISTASNQIRYYACLEWAGISAKFEKGNLWIQFRTDTAGNLVANELKVFGEINSEKLVMVRTGPKEYTVYVHHNEGGSFFKYRPIFEFAPTGVFEYLHEAVKVSSLPVGDRYLFSSYDPCPKELDGGSATSVYLITQIIDGGNAQSFTS